MLLEPISRSARAPDFLPNVPNDTVSVGAAALAVQLALIGLLICDSLRLQHSPTTDAALAGRWTHVAARDSPLFLVGRRMEATGGGELTHKLSVSR